ncbi:hypothetical protein ART_0462 [Arthrobacter sp. PAMC 25486]|nr:hypothetical protein ART_0462 [Arthrobacter sp. PAMC 25486]
MPTAVRLPEETGDRLTESTGRPKSCYLRELITSGLDKLEWEYSVAQKATDIRAGRRKTIPAETVRAELGLDD